MERRKQDFSRITSKDITAKDFRGALLATMALDELESFDSAAQAKRNLRSAIEKVAGKLGNTQTIYRKCYVHPEVLNSTWTASSCLS